MQDSTWPLPSESYSVTKLKSFPPADMFIWGIGSHQTPWLDLRLVRPWLVLRVGFCLFIGLPGLPVDEASSLQPPTRNCAAGTASGLSSFFLVHQPPFPVTFPLFPHCLCEFLKSALPFLKLWFLCQTLSGHTGSTLSATSRRILLMIFVTDNY
jgi:hypothetical protein